MLSSFYLVLVILHVHKTSGQDLEATKKTPIFTEWAAPKQAVLHCPNISPVLRKKKKKFEIRLSGAIDLWSNQECSLDLSATALEMLEGAWARLRSHKQLERDREAVLTYIIWRHVQLPWVDQVCKRTQRLFVYLSGVPMNPSLHVTLQQVPLHHVM